MLGGGWAGGISFRICTALMLSSPKITTISCVCVCACLSHVALLRVSLPRSPVLTGSPEFNSAVSPAVGDVFELELLESKDCQSRRQCTFWVMGYALLALRVEVNPAHAPTPLVKADVIKPLKTRSRNRAYPVIRDEEVLLPAHEDILTLC